MKTRVIFASVILGLATTWATAATTTNTDDSPAANKPASAMLVNDSQKQFTLFGERNMTQFTHTTNWQNFMSTISLYNQNPAAVLMLSPADRAKFNEATAQVIHTLAKQKSAEASRWTNQANYTARMINFLWNVDQQISQNADVQ